MTRRKRPATVHDLVKALEKDRVAQAKARKIVRRTKTRQAVRWTARNGWAGRRIFGMFYAGLAVQVLGFALPVVPSAAGAVLLGSLALIAVLLLVGRARKWPRFERVYFVAAVVFGASWLLTVVKVGAGAPMPGVLLGVTVAGAVPWWVHAHRRQPDVEPAVVIDKRLADFEASGPGNYLPDGTRIPVHTLEDVQVDDDGDGESDMLGWAGVIQLPAGCRETFDSIVAAKKNLAATWQVPEESIVIELAPDRIPDKARVMVLDRRNPTHEVNYYDRSWVLLRDGCYPFGVFPDGSRSWLRLYQEKDGPTHSLFSGDSGAGKSRGVSLKITQETLTGLVVPFIADPQGGQSMPAWAGVEGKAAWIATDEDEIWIQVQALKRLMWSRSARLTAREWVDEDGVTRKGLNFHDPLVVPDMPIISWTLEEAHDILSETRFVDPIEGLARMTRKTGIGLTLVTQYPSIMDLGNRMPIRNQLGNVVCYKLKTRVGAGMILPSWAPNPFDIPQVTAAGQHTKGTNVTTAPAPGGARPTFQRSAYVKNEHKWADIAAERIPALPQDDQDAMGDDWYQRWERRAKALAAPAIIDLATRRSEASASTASQSTRDKVLAYLAEHGTTRTGVIANDLSLSLPAAGKMLQRLAADGLVRDVRHGEWAPAETTEATG